MPPGANPRDSDPNIDVDACRPLAVTFVVGCDPCEAPGGPAMLNAWLSVEEPPIGALLEDIEAMIPCGGCDTGVMEGLELNGPRPTEFPVKGKVFLISNAF